MNGDVILNFYVQLRNNPSTQSIISARSLWEESEAIPYKVATLTFPQQNINARKQEEYGESLAFNIWRTLPDLEPVGSIAEARKVVYSSSSTLRRNVNGQIIAEPSEARKPNYSGHPYYTPTTETPWPVGTLGNATENFQGFGSIILEPNHYNTFNEITISARDMEIPIYVNGYSMLDRSLIEGVSFFNTFTNGKLRILFEQHKMKKVSFDLSSQNILLSNGGLKITAHTMEDQINNIASVTSIMDMNGRVDIELLPGGKYFNLIIIEFNQNGKQVSLNNFIMTFM